MTRYHVKRLSNGHLVITLHLRRNAIEVADKLASGQVVEWTALVERERKVPDKAGYFVHMETATGKLRLIHTALVDTATAHPEAPEPSSQAPPSKKESQ